MSPSTPPLTAARLSALLAADAAGYSRLMAIGDRRTVGLLDAARAVFRDACAEHQGAWSTWPALGAADLRLAVHRDALGAKSVARFEDVGGMR